MKLKNEEPFKMILGCLESLRTFVRSVADRVLLLERTVKDIELRMHATALKEMSTANPSTDQVIKRKNTRSKYKESKHLKGPLKNTGIKT